MKNSVRFLHDFYGGFLSLMRVMFCHFLRFVPHKISQVISVHICNISSSREHVPQHVRMHLDLACRLDFAHGFIHHLQIIRLSGFRADEDKIVLI